MSCSAYFEKGLIIWEQATLTNKGETEMKELNTKLTGIIASVETAPTKKNTVWHKINVEVGDKTYTGEGFRKDCHRVHRKVTQDKATV